MVIISRLSEVAYLNVTINVKPEMHHWRLEPMGLANPGETRCLTGTGLGLAHQESAGKILTGSGIELTNDFGPNADRWRVTQIRCQHYIPHTLSTVFDHIGLLESWMESPRHIAHNHKHPGMYTIWFLL
jgi:hypothetical protein